MLQVVVNTGLYRAPHDRENTTAVEAGVVDRQQVTPNERMVVPRQRPVTSLLMGKCQGAQTATASSGQLGKGGDLDRVAWE